MPKTIGNKRHFFCFVWLYLKINISDFRLILLDHITYRLFSLVWAFCSSLVPSGPIVSLHGAERPVKQTTNKLTSHLKFCCVLMLMLQLQNKWASCQAGDSIHIYHKSNTDKYHLLQCWWISSSLLRVSKKKGCFRFADVVVMLVHHLKLLTWIKVNGSWHYKPGIRWSHLQWHRSLTLIQNCYLENDIEMSYDT